MKITTKVVGMFIFVLSANFNFLVSVPDNKSLFFQAPADFWGFGKPTKSLNEIPLSPELFYSENSSMKVLPNEIETSIASFKCVAKKLVAFDCSQYIDDIQYQGLDRTTNERILFGIKTHYDCEKSKMIRYFWIEVYSENSEFAAFENIIVLEDEDPCIDSLLGFDAQETLNFIQKFFNEVFIARVGDCVKI